MVRDEDSEDRFCRLYEENRDGIARIGLDGRLLSVNPRYEQLTGYTIAELEGTRWRELIPEHGREVLEQARCGLLRLGHTPTIETTHIGKDGNELPVEVWLLLERDENKQAVAEWAFVRDISERWRTERQLRHTQKMLAVSRLSGGIAHDFNNVLTTILGFAELARKGAGQLPEATTRDYLERVLDAGVRGRDLISQMLTFSRGTSGATQTSVRLGSSVREMTQSLSSVMPSGIHVSLSVPEQDPVVDVDPIQLQQMLLNLCMNARDAMHGEGKLCIGVRPIHYSGRECAGCFLPVDGNWVELSVADTGEGIPAAIQNNIFDPFFTTKKRGEGSGMGLSVLHGVMHGHDGHVLVESEPQEGTTFRVLFPGSG